MSKRFIDYLDDFKKDRPRTEEEVVAFCDGYVAALSNYHDVDKATALPDFLKAAKEARPRPTYAGAAEKVGNY